MGLSKQEQKDYARTLFIDQKLTIKAVAARSKVTEKTIGKWADEGNWKRQRVSLLTTKSNQINFLYEQLDWLNTDISMRDIPVATTSEADRIIKITAAIKNLEIESDTGHFIEVCKALINLISGDDMELAKKLIPYCDILIQKVSSKKIY